MPRTFHEILPALEARLQRAKQGALPIGHAMELRRREERHAMGCPNDEEICGYVDGKLRVCSAKRWAAVRCHVQRCPHCQDDVEGLCEALELNWRDVPAHAPLSIWRSRFMAPVAAIAAMLVLAVLAVQIAVPMVAGWSADRHDINPGTSPLHAPALAPRHLLTMPTQLDQSGVSTLNVSVPLDVDAGVSVSSVWRVAICSETELPTCGAGMALMRVMEAACEVMGDENACFAQSANGGCAICLVAQQRGIE